MKHRLQRVAVLLLLTIFLSSLGGSGFGNIPVASPAGNAGAFLEGGEVPAQPSILPDRAALQPWLKEQRAQRGVNPASPEPAPGLLPQLLTVLPSYSGPLSTGPSASPSPRPQLARSGLHTRGPPSA